MALLDRGIEDAHAKTNVPGDIVSFLCKFGVTNYCDNRSFIQQAYTRLKKPRLTLNKTISLLEEINFRAPKELIKVKFDVSSLAFMNVSLHLANNRLTES